ncbi:synaptotagmin-9-like [Paramacrobiotus metropolitanus]|uniref:synaptotagmin-9-like n=1 Tax=Paramacrobiotus metropolitanus TaxID=2943436 RepID=UPI002445A273|nr:synaptotagmin-9-like [Paramacrobiotus metropolitanus]
MSTINKRWASIKSMVKEKKVVVLARNQSPSPSPTPKNRSQSLADGPLGTSPQNMPRFQIPKTITEVRSDRESLQRKSTSKSPNRKLLRLNTEHNLLSQNKSAPSSPVVTHPVKVNDKRRLTIAPMAPIYPNSRATSPSSKSPSPKHPGEFMTQRSRRASYAPAFISINVQSVEEDEDSQDNALKIDENINLTLSPSLNSMCDPKYWDNATPDYALRLKPPQRDRLYSRRRSSALSNLSSEDNNLSRSTYSLCERDLYRESKEKILNFRRLSLAPQLAISQIAMQKPRRTRSANKLEAKLIADMGELKFSVRYFADWPGLRVTVIRGENIGGKIKNDAQVNSFVTVCLLPGKQQKQSGKIQKGTKNPVYNEEFEFMDMDWETLEHHLLRISVQNQKTLKNDDLGEVLLPLLRLDPDVDNRMWKDLRKKCQNPMQESGYLQIRTRFSKQTKKLTVLVIKAQDLLRSSLIGPPDTYVRLEVIQNERKLDRKQTKLVKRTKNPIYKEAFSFVLGISLDEIKHTTVELTVYAKENLFGSAALGQVILGYGSTEESELRHWSLTMREYGKEFTKWHALMPIDDKET